MGRNLRDLIRCSGYAGTSGQSFRYHVTGSGTGTKMSDYLISDWSASSGGPDPMTYYNGGAVLNTTMTFTQGSKAPLIMRKGNVIGVEVDPNEPVGFNVTISSNVIGTTATLTQTLSAPYNVASSATIATPWFEGYTSPNTPGGTDEEEIRFTASKVGGAAGGTSQCDWVIDYTPDLFEFNPTMEYPFTATMNNAADTGGWEWEWYYTSDYTGSPFSTNASSVTSVAFGYTYPGETVTLYVRGRPAGTGQSWRLANRSFTDPR